MWARLEKVWMPLALSTLLLGASCNDSGGLMSGDEGGDPGTAVGGSQAGHGGGGGDSGSAAGGASSGGTAGTDEGGASMGGATNGGTDLGGADAGGTDSGGTSTGGTSIAGTSAAGGGAGGDGGNEAGSAGAPGGAGNGGMAGGGAGGAGGAGGLGTGGIGALVGRLDGRLIQTTCGDQPSTDDCNACLFVDGVLLLETFCRRMRPATFDHPIGGTPGASYQLTMHFYGIVEGKYYGQEVVRDAGTARPGDQNAGADPSPWAVGTPGMTIPGGTSNSYELHVFDDQMQEVGVYFLNSDTQEEHVTYVLNFQKTIRVVGGGFVRLTNNDPNCRQIKNCGSTAGFPCASKARVVDISAADPQPPVASPSMGGLMQPGLGGPADHGGQWLLIDVTAITPT